MHKCRPLDYCTVTNAGLSLGLGGLTSQKNNVINISKINWDAKFVRYYNEVFYG